jgi:F-type H+-transporting ATPase subunit a
VLSCTATLAAGDPMNHVVPHALFSIGGFTVTNHILMGCVAALLVLAMFTYAAGRIRPAGHGRDGLRTRGIFANLLETLCVFIREEVVRPNLQHLTDKYIYYIWTVFFFILTCNLVGLIPFGPIIQLVAAPFGVEGHNLAYLGHFGGTATGNLSLNLPLAFLSFVLIIGIGIREVGLKHFLAHFNPVGWSPAMLPIGIMVFFLEWLGLVIKSTVLAMRLFGTMMAGHLVIAVFLSLIPVSIGGAIAVGIPVTLGSVALLLLEVFIALLQAFIFTFLTTLFIASTAVPEEGHDHAEQHDQGQEEPQLIED